jgi:hypothetical protein
MAIDLRRTRLEAMFSRSATIGLGTAAIIWSIAVLPGFVSLQKLADVTSHIIAGDIYKPSIFEAIEMEVDGDRALSRRPSSLSKISILRLRRTELELAVGDRRRIDSDLEALYHSVDDALANSPSDSFLWLVRFWIENTQHGFKLENLRYLQMSYRRGTYEGWVAIKRSRFALALFPMLDADLAEAAVAEFIELVRSGVFTQAAADIFIGPGWPIRGILFSRLSELKMEQRQYFARLLNDRGIDDVSALNVDKPHRLH